MLDEHTPNPSQEGKRHCDEPESAKKQSVDICFKVISGFYLLCKRLLRSYLPRNDELLLLVRHCDKSERAKK
jgi:hypothetical protein